MPRARPAVLGLQWLSMNRYAPLLVVLCAAGASAQFVARGSVLPVLAPVTPVVAPRLSAPTLTLMTPALPVAALPPAALASVRPSIAVAAIPQAAAKAAPAAAAAQPLAAAAKAIEAVHGAAPAAAPILDRLFEARAQTSGEAVAAGSFSQSLRASLSRPALNAVRPAAEPAPPAPGWKRAALAVGRGAGFLVSLWAGMQAADVAYSLAVAKLGAASAFLFPVALGLGAWYLRRLDRSLGSRLFWGGMLASASFSAVGQLLWDLTGSPLGLAGGLAFGVAAALYSAGLGKRGG